MLNARPRSPLPASSCSSSPSWFGGLKRQSPPLPPAQKGEERESPGRFESTSSSRRSSAPTPGLQPAHGALRAGACRAPPARTGPRTSPLRQPPSWQTAPLAETTRGSEGRAVVGEGGGLTGDEDLSYDPR